MLCEINAKNLWNLGWFGCVSQPKWSIILLLVPSCFCFRALCECLFFFLQTWLDSAKEIKKQVRGKWTLPFLFFFLLVGHRISNHFLAVCHLRILTIADDFEMEIKPSPRRRRLHNRKIERDGHCWDVGQILIFFFFLTTRQSWRQ